MTAVAAGSPVETPGAAFFPPGPGPRPADPSLIAQLRLSLTNSIEAWPRAVYEERTYKPPVPGLPLFIMDPALIRSVLVEQADRFTQGHLFRRLLLPIWRRGLATAEGPEWRWQRKAAAPAFRPAGLAFLVPGMRSAAEAALERWSKAGEGAVHEMTGETSRIMFDIILDALLSGGEDLDRGATRARIAAFTEPLGEMRLSYFIAPDSFHRGRQSGESAEASALRAEVDRMIRRRRSAPRRGDLVDLLMQATDPETGRAMDDETLRDNILGFIAAGHGTSAVALAWALYLLSQHPRTAERIRTEVAEVAGGRPIEPEQVERLVFTRQVIQETMRLYPPAHGLIRVCTRKTDLGGRRLRPGSRIIVPIYALHRHRLWWRDPDVFDPDRFSAPQPQPDRHLYLPFGAGPRICIGAAFAMTELVVVLATLVRHASFNLVAEHPVWPLAELVLRPRDGLPMSVCLDAEGGAAA